MENPKKIISDTSFDKIILPQHYICILLPMKTYHNYKTTQKKAFMKNLFKHLFISILALTATATFTSCDEDVDQAMMMSGQWRGDFGMFYYYRYGNRVYRFDSYDTDIIFYPKYDYATYGSGKQIDYYFEGPYSYQYYYFDWSIKDGVIYLTYPYDHELDADIYNYYMDEDRFYGRFGNSDSRFSLYKLTDYYDWGRHTGEWSHGGFVDGWGWDDYRGDYYDDFYYGKKRVNDTAEDSAGKVVGRGNRFVKK